MVIISKNLLRMAMRTKAVKSRTLLIITPYFKDPHRGVASAYKLAEQMSKHGHKVHVLTAQASGQPKEEQFGTITIHRTKDIFIKDPFNFNIMPNLWPRLWTLTKKIRPDMAFIAKHFFFTTLAAPILKLKKIPFAFVIDTFPGICWFSGFKTRDRAVALYTKTLGKLFMNMANKIILLHEGLLPIAKKLNFKHAQVIHNGVSKNALDKTLPAIKKKKDEIIITYAGRLESVKRWVDILEVARIIAKKRTNIRFLFVGDTKGKTIQKIERIEFLGFREDIKNIFASSDINVLFSDAEGLPNTLMEAMAQGNAIVASDVGGVRALIKDKKTGLLVPRRNKKALEEALLTLIDNNKLRATLGEQAKKHIKEHFTWENIVLQYDKLIEEIL